MGRPEVEGTGTIWQNEPNDLHNHVVFNWLGHISGRPQAQGRRAFFLGQGLHKELYCLTAVITDLSASGDPNDGGRDEDGTRDRTVRAGAAGPLPSCHARRDASLDWQRPLVSRPIPLHGGDEAMQQDLLRAKRQPSA